ncbi:MAG: galactose mutarotase [Clostridiales bacterium]|nr:galactose mutarotase [Clostridiales bacterium]
MSITITPFGQTPQGERADLITVTNKKGESASFTNFGAHIVSIKVQDKFGNLGEVCLGQDDAAQYARSDIGYMGGTIGRYGNRIAGAQFELNGKVYHLYANDGANTLHGGQFGFDQKLWEYELSDNSILMYYTSPDMEEGFPGELKVQVRFHFDEESQLSIDYEAISDQDTQVNLTNHAYFNLGHGEDILNHTLQIDADDFVEVDDDLIPTGELQPVEGTVYDLRQPVLLGEALKRRDHDMFLSAKGFDAAFVLNEKEFHQAAVLQAPDTGRSMKVWTDQPGVQCYSGQGLNCSGHDGIMYGPYAGIALETQQHPDTLHHPTFGSTLLKAGDLYKTKTVYAFSAQ